METKLCVDTKMERREDGILVTFIMADGSHMESYMTFQEFFVWGDQMKALDPRTADSASEGAK